VALVGLEAAKSKASVCIGSTSAKVRAETPWRRCWVHWWQHWAVHLAGPGTGTGGVAGAGAVCCCCALLLPAQEVWGSLAALLPIASPAERLPWPQVCNNLGLTRVTYPEAPGIEGWVDCIVAASKEMEVAA
jgi:hypothetical protein